MAKSKIMKAKVTPEQYARMLQLAHLHGYKNVSDYLRDLALNRGPAYDVKLTQIYEIVLAILRMLQEKEDKTKPSEPE